MRRIFNEDICRYTFKPEEINASELYRWDKHDIANIIKKIGVDVGHLKTEQFDEIFIAYFSCKLHKKSKYMLITPEYEVYYARNLKEISFTISMKKNGVKCQCLKPDVWEEGIKKILACFMQTSDDEDSEDVELNDQIEEPKNDQVEDREELETEHCK
ncbi:hypothetical protein ACKWTF_010952 [Chironomus riparius]